MRMLLVASALAGLAARPVPLAAQAPTFNADVAPILQAHCVACHRPDGGAPFSLLTYGDVRRRATLVAKVTAERYMPPWKPHGAPGEFVGDRRLTADEIAVIGAWAAGGAASGDGEPSPASPAGASGWQLGPPDLVISMPAPYLLPADGGDVFRSFVVPVDLAAGRYVAGLEFRTTAPEVVHHAAFKIDPTPSSRELDAEDADEGYSGGAGRNARFPDGQFLAWTPGQSPSRLPEGMAWRLEPGDDFVFELHLLPRGRPEAVRATVGLYFTDVPPTRLTTILRTGSQTIDIPPGEPHYVVTDRFVLPVAVRLMAVQPHAHLLARTVEASARLPDGSVTPLLAIDDWDFRWQDVYQYRTPVVLPKGTTLTSRFTYDNTEANPRNPYHPPQRVTYGQTTASEMGNVWFQVVVDTVADLDAINRQHDEALLAGDIAGVEKMLQRQPSDASLHRDLGFLYLTANRRADGKAQLREASRLDPSSAATVYALGTIALGDRDLVAARQELSRAIGLRPSFAAAFINLGIVSQAEGKLDEAAGEYRQALRHDRRNPQAHYNLGRLLARQGRFDEAIAAYREALASRPDDADVLLSLAAALSMTNAVEEAVATYRSVLAIRADDPGALVDLSWLLATSSVSNPAEAVHLSERADRLTGHRQPTVLDTLAVAYFAAGRVREAIATEQTAIDCASATGDPALLAGLRDRLISFERGQP